MVFRIEKVATRQHLPGLRTCLHDSKAALVMGLRTMPALPISRIHTAASGLSARLLSFLHVPIVVYFVSEWSHYDMSIIYVKDYP